MVVHDCLWLLVLPTVVHGCVWCVYDCYGCLWLVMAGYGCLCVFVGVLWFVYG